MATRIQRHRIGTAVQLGGVDPAQLDAAAADAVAASPAIATVGVLSALRFDPAHPNYGAVRGTGASSAQRTANTAAINLAASDAAAAGGTLVIKGEYEFDDTLTFNCHVDADGASLYINDTTINPAILSGTTASGVRARNLRQILPSLYQTGKTALGVGVWGADVGIEVANANSCDITLQRTQGFGTNLKISSYGQGNTYNEYHLGHLDNGKVNLQMSPDATGWVNENNLYGGRFSQNTAEGTNVSGVRQIRATGVANSINNNKFLKPSIEGNVPEYHIDLTNARFNVFDQARWEATPPKVRLEDSTGNVFDYGYNAMLIEWTIVGTHDNTVWRHRDGQHIRGAGAKGVLTLENQGSASYPVLSVVSPGAGLNAATETAYQYQLSAAFSNYKAAADAHPRIQINHGLGRILFGTGTAAPTHYLRAWGTGIQSSGPIAVNGATPAAKPTITGSRGGNAALASLLTQLATMGFITDSTTA